MEKRYGGGSLRETAAGALGLPGEVVADLPRVEVVGGQRVVVENHKGLLEYTENEVRVAGKSLTVVIRGDALLLESMTVWELLVTGRIFGVDFEY